MNSSYQMIGDTTREDLQRLKWAGWVVASCCLLSWAGWVSLVAIGNTTNVKTVEERQSQQYMHLRDDIAELKAIMLKGVR